MHGGPLWISVWFCFVFGPRLLYIYTVHTFICIKRGIACIVCGGDGGRPRAIWEGGKLFKWGRMFFFFFFFFFFNLFLCFFMLQRSTTRSLAHPSIHLSIRPSICFILISVQSILHMLPGESGRHWVTEGIVQLFLGQMGSDFGGKYYTCVIIFLRPSRQGLMGNCY